MCWTGSPFSGQAGRRQWRPSCCGITTSGSKGWEFLATILPWQNRTWLHPGIQVATWLSWGCPCPEKGAIPDL